MSFQKNAGTVHEIRPRPLPFITSPTRYSIVLSQHATSSEILMAQLNKPHQVHSGELIRFEMCSLIVDYFLKCLVRLYHSKRQNPCYFRENEAWTFCRSFPFANFVVMYLVLTDLLICLIEAKG